MAPPRVAIFTLTMNRLDYTRQMISSLGSSTDVPFDHFVVDNGSVDGTRAFLESRPGRITRVLFNDANVGLPGGWNQALDLVGSDYDYVVKVDNDCEFVEAGWLEALIDVCEGRGKRIVLSPYVEGLSLGNEGGHPRHETTTCAGHVLGLSNHVGGLCLFVPSEAYQGFRFGKTPMHGNNDVRFSLYARLKLGYEMGYVEDVRVRHIETTGGQHLRYPEYWQQRPEQKTRVYGENKVVTRLLRLPRRMVLLWQMDRGGLLEGGIARYLLNRVGHRIPGRTHLSDGEAGEGDDR